MVFMTWISSASSIVSRCSPKIGFGVLDIVNPFSPVFRGGLGLISGFGVFMLNPFSPLFRELG